MKLGKSIVLLLIGCMFLSSSAFADVEGDYTYTSEWCKRHYNEVHWCWREYHNSCYTWWLSDGGDWDCCFWG